jgi:hypothetical protein
MILQNLFADIFPEYLFRNPNQFFGSGVIKISSLPFRAVFVTVIVPYPLPAARCF